MFEKRFTEEERKEAEKMLGTLAERSMQYWVDAISSRSFQTDVTDEKIAKFKEIYMEATKKTIQRILNSDRDIASVLGKDSRVEVPRCTDEFYFGGCSDGKPWGEVAVALTTAGINGSFRKDSKYNNTHIILKDGRLYECRTKTVIVLTTEMEPLL